jgi:FAD dependent oxidoreductase
MGAPCDVLVVGAGVAGATAAVAAARGGARTILVEKESYFGGAGFAGMFQYVCGLYLNAEAPPADTLNGGLVSELVGLLRKAAPEKIVKKMGKVYVLPYARDGLQSALTSLCCAETDLAVLRGHAAVSVTKRGGEVADVVVEGGRGRQVITPKVVIDCSGSGSVAEMAGAVFELAPDPERQLAGFVARVKGLKDVDEDLSFKVPFALAQAANQGLLPPEAKFTLFSPGDAADEGYCKMSLRSGCGDDAEKARAAANAAIRRLASVLPAFRDSYIAETSPGVLEREGRRIIGAYVLTKEDVLSARKFSDGVVKNAWPIELWDRTRGTIFRYVPRGEYYDIPFRCLTVRDVGNMLTAGRCISASREALGSTRVMGACMALGEQAGKAAAYRVKNGSYPEGRF